MRDFLLLGSQSGRRSSICRALAFCIEVSNLKIGTGLDGLSLLDPGQCYWGLLAIFSAPCSPAVGAFQAGVFMA